MSGDKILVEDAKVINEVNETKPVNKLDAFELQSLHDLNKKRQAIGNDIVKVKIIERQAKQLNESIDAYLTGVEAEESAIFKNLEAKYGKININLENGEFVQAQEQ